MKIGILGSGSVGQQLGLGFAKAGYAVKLGTRHPEKLNEWLASAGENASVSSFEDAAAFGDLIVLATKWQDGATENALHLAGKQHFKNKTVIDVTNPLLFTEQGKAPELAVAYPKSGGAIIQQLLPEAKVVKAFNTVTAHYMANPHLKEGTPDLFIAGNDVHAKKTVVNIAQHWGWQVHDIGDIHQSYLLEALAMLWIRYGFLNNRWTHAFKLLKE